MTYDVIRYSKRPDGRIEPSGKPERLNLTHDEAMALSHTAVVVSTTSGPNGSRFYIHNGQHAQFDSRLGWLS